MKTDSLRGHSYSLSNIRQTYSDNYHANHLLSLDDQALLSDSFINFPENSSWMPTVYFYGITADEALW